MNDNFKTLDCDEDVLLFNRDAYTVARFRELVEQNIKGNFNHNMNPQSIDRVIDFLSRLHIPTGDHPAFLVINFGHINWMSDRKGINCKILKMGAKNWQEGKVRIEANVSYGYSKGIEIKCVVEFCPDEPLEPESPLDDLRKLIGDD